MTEFAHAPEGHRRELRIHCYCMLGSLPDVEDAVQETMLRAWRYRDSLKEGAPLRPWLYRVATNTGLDAIAHDERRAVLAARSAAYVRRPGDSAWHALALDVLRIEDGGIAEIVTFPPDCFLPFGLPLIMDETSEVDSCH